MAKKKKKVTVTLTLTKLASYSDGENRYQKGVRYAVEKKAAEVLLGTGHFQQSGKDEETEDEAE